MTRLLNPAMPIVIVDDESHVLQSTETLLMGARFNNIRQCQDSRELMGLLAEVEAGIVLLDLSMPFLSGQQLLTALLETHPEVPVIIVSGVNEAEIAVECMNAGAYDYVFKPVESNRFLAGVQRALELREARNENRQLRQYLFSKNGPKHPEAFADIAANPFMQGICRYVEIIAGTSHPVLITGECGVGKQLLASALHTLSGRTGPFTSVDVAGLDEAAFSDAIFGHMRGAFAGATEFRKGLAEQTQGGTLLLNEIGGMDSASQAKLLRLVQKGEYCPIGSNVAKWTDVRVVVTASVDLESLKETGQFRKDLYHRLQVHRIDVPPRQA